MADSNKTISIDIIVDDKGNVSIDKLTSSVKALAKENKATKDSQVSLVQQIQKLQSASKRTADVIKNEISLRKKLISSTATTNKEYLKGSLQVTKLENELRRLNKTQDQSTTGNASLRKGLGNTASSTGAASGAVVELGRTISDSNYGFPAMANNVQQLATQLVFVTKESGGVRGAFRDLIKAMTGAGGLLLLFTVGVTLLERFSLQQRKAKQATNELNKSIGSEVSSLKNLVAIAKNENISKESRQIAVNKLNRDYPKYLGNIDLESIATEELNGLIEKQIKLEIQRAKVRALSEKIAEENIKLLDLEVNGVADNLNTTQQLFFGFTSKLATDFGFGVENVTKKALDISSKNAEKEVTKTKERIGKLTSELQSIIEETPDAIDAVTGDVGVERPKIEPFFQDPEVIKEQAHEALMAGTEARNAEFESIFEHERRKQELYDKNNEADQKRARQVEFRENKERQDRENTLTALAASTAAASALFEEGTAANKFFSIATATIDTYVAANAILADPALKGNPPARFAGAAAAILTGLANVKKIIEVNVPSKEGSSSSSIQPPDFNIVGASQQSQLAQTISASSQEPTRAYVVAEDVRTANELDRNIIEGASLG